jgi:F-type H+-transporting ATPase subunit a
MPDEGGSLIHVRIDAEPLFHIGPLTVTNSMVGAVVTSLILLAVAWYVTRRATLVPSRLQAAIEFPIEWIGDIVAGTGGSRWRSFAPLVITIFIFVLIANWLGLLPGVGTIGLFEEEHGEQVLVPFVRSASADLNFTLGLALVSFFAFIGFGLKANGVGGYLKHTFIANPWYMTPIMTPIHLISEFSRLISLSMRLFGNVFAGEVLLATMLALVPLIVPIAFLGLELVFGFVQALVFALLTMTYVILAIAENEEHGKAELEDPNHEHSGDQPDRHAAPQGTAA